MPELLTYFCLLALLTAPQRMAGTIHPRKIILIAGKTSRGPGKHEYIESVRLLLLVRVPALSTTPQEQTVAWAHQ